MKKTLLISSLVIIAILSAEAYRENIDMAWRGYQKKYKLELFRLAKTDQERQTARNFEIRMRQFVLPEINRVDRCVSCHVAMEDFRMSDMSNPLKSHPGNYLDTHDVNRIGCTVCHDGQGRAVTAADAHAEGGDKYWEKPVLRQPFLESNCVRCHANTLAQIPYYNQGKELFKTRGCTACHQIQGSGGNVGPDLTDIGNASFHVKVPAEQNRNVLFEKFHHNVNLAYMYEAITDPRAQPVETKMPEFILSEGEKAALLVYLKSLSEERRVMDVGVVPPAESVAPVAAIASSLAEPVSGAEGVAPSKGYIVFMTRCIACHTVGEGKRVGPDLKGVAARRDRAWMKKFIQMPSVVFNEKDPIAIKLLDEFKTPMTDLGLTDAEVEDVIGFLENPVIPAVPAATAAMSPVGVAGAGIPIEGMAVTTSDVAKGRDLFQGKWRFLNGGPSCISCHHVRNDTVISGGALAKDLTAAFSRLGGRLGIRPILAASPFPVMQKAYKNHPLTDDEMFALTAFLEEADKEKVFQKQPDYGMRLLTGGIAGAFILLGCYTVFWRRRKKNPVHQDVFDRQIKSE
jgi:cytochrome c2